MTFFVAGGAKNPVGLASQPGSESRATTDPIEREHSHGNQETSQPQEPQGLSPPHSSQPPAQHRPQEQPPPLASSQPPAQHRPQEQPTSFASSFASPQPSSEPVAQLAQEQPSPFAASQPSPQSPSLGRTVAKRSKRGGKRRTRRKGVRPKDVVETAGREVNVQVYPGRGGSGERALNGLKSALTAIPKHLR